MVSLKLSTVGEHNTTHLTATEHKAVYPTILVGEARMALCGGVQRGHESNGVHKSLLREPENLAR
jgi:hypothetical protein